VKSSLGTPSETTLIEAMVVLLPVGPVKVSCMEVVCWRSMEPKLTGPPGERPWAKAEGPQRASSPTKISRRLERTAASEIRCLLE
jgi:hypothetical protein